MAETRRRRICILAGVMAVLLLVVPSLVLLKIKSRQDALHDRGVVTQAVVIEVERDDPDILWVKFDACPCQVPVPTTNAGAHPVGSAIAVRYDREKPSRAEALADSPDPYEDLYGVGIGIGVAVLICVPIVALGLRHSRRAKVLVATTAPTGAVRVEAWERSLLNQEMAYLSVYDVAAPPGSPPRMCFPVDPAKVEDIEADDVFELFGPGRPGEPLALRRGDLVMVPAGKTQTAEWEARHRQPHADLGPRPQPGGVPLIAPIAVFRDAHDAQVYRRLTRLLRWLYVLFLPVALFRLAPDHLLSRVLTAVFVYLGVLFAAQGWHRVLLGRLARRLPGPAPSGYAGRRAARSAVLRHLASPPGRAELAGHLGTTPDDLDASDRQFMHRLITSAVVAGVLVVAAVVRFAVV